MLNLAFRDSLCLRGSVRGSTASSLANELPLLELQADTEPPIGQSLAINNSCETLLITCK